MAAEEVKGMERMLRGRKRQKREVKETRVDRWLSLPPSSVIALGIAVRISLTTIAQLLQKTKNMY